MLCSGAFRHILRFPSQRRVLLTTRYRTLGLIAVLGLGVHAAIWSVGPPGGLAQQPPVKPPLVCTPPAAEAGFARPWEASIRVSTYSTVNTRHGNLLTVIPVIGWNGVGPDMGFALYHNSAAVEEDSLTETSLGFDVGPGWSTSYSGVTLFNSLSLHAKGVFRCSQDC